MGYGFETQPACWREAASRAAGAALLLPHFGEHVAVTGSGWSWFSAQAFAWLRQEAGHGPTEAFTPSEVPPFRTFDRAIVLSSSGADPETIRYLHRLREEAVLTTVVTASGTSEAATLAGHLIVLEFAAEEAPGTRFDTSAMAFFRSHLGHEMDTAIAEAEEALLEPMEAAASPASEHRVSSGVPLGPQTLVWHFGAPDPAVLDEVEAAGATVRISQRDPMAELVLAQATASRVNARE